MLRPILQMNRRASGFARLGLGAFREQEACRAEYSAACSTHITGHVGWMESRLV